jgi:hypothetical protein
MPLIHTHFCSSVVQVSTAMRASSTAAPNMDLNHLIEPVTEFVRSVPSSVGYSSSARRVASGETLNCSCMVETYYFSFRIEYF